MLSKGLGLFFGFCFILVATQGVEAAESAKVRVVSEQGSARVIQAETDIDAPVSVVWESLTNYANMKNILPGYNRSTVLQNNGNSKTVELGLKPSALAPSFVYQVKIKEDKGSNTINIQRISGDFKAITASYKLISIDNGTHTRLVYNLQIDMGSSMPAIGATQVLKSNTEKGMVAMQQHCSRSYKRSLSASAAK